MLTRSPIRQLDPKGDDGRLGLKLIMEKNLPSLNLSQVKELLVKTLSSWVTERDRLNELDRALGDGDHGSTISRGAQAAIDSLQTGNFSSVNQVFAAVGRAMMTSMGGASGMLFGLFFRSAERVPASEVLDLVTLSALFDRGLDDLKARTKAQPGDKTMFDALIPALTTLRESRGDLISALDRAASSAIQGAQETVDLLPKFGRAKTLGERARGTADPGAISVALFFTGLAANAKSLSPQT
jgi:phosphoenolpyruvate---glycerone phosphotransferase subunit DhaL